MSTKARAPEPDLAADAAVDDELLVIAMQLQIQDLAELSHKPADGDLRLAQTVFLAECTHRYNTARDRLLALKLQAAVDAGESTRSQGRLCL